MMWRFKSSHPHQKWTKVRIVAHLGGIFVLVLKRASSKPSVYFTLTLRYAKVMGPIIRHFDDTISTAIRSLPVGLGWLMASATLIGSPVIVMPLFLGIGLFALVRSRWHLVWASVGVFVVIGFNTLIKLTFQRIRPTTEYAAHMWFKTYSFPSGHSCVSMVGYGLLAYFAVKLFPFPLNIIVAVALACLILLVGVSRIYLGAHYPSDVLAGWLVGAIGLLVIIFFVRPLA